MERFNVDAAAMAVYARSADEVAGKLTAAAADITGAADLDRIAQLATDLGAIGAEFVARAAAILGEHATVLDTAAAQVRGYGEALTQWTDTTTRSDGDTAAAIARTTTTLDLP
jgi:hypothetical protein